MTTLIDRLRKLERAGTGGDEARWRADRERQEQGYAEARRKVAAIIARKLAERGMDPDHRPPQTPEQHAAAMRALLIAVKARLRDRNHP